MIKKIYDNYFIDSGGSIYSNKRKGSKGHFIAQNINMHGYKIFKIWSGNKTKCIQLHRELAKNFIPNPKKLRCVNHKDGNKLNNSIENLEWCTYSENLKHAYSKGLRKDKSKSGHKYVTWESQTNSWRVSINIDKNKVIKGGRHKSIASALLEKNKILKTIDENKTK